MMTKPLFVNVGYEHPVEFPIHLVISTDDFSVVHCTKRRMTKVVVSWSGSM
ncbi:hypothetical protein LINPERPRIM_LOCUS25404 [Linum perenne]